MVVLVQWNWSALHGQCSRWMVVIVGVICRWCLLCCWWSSAASLLLMMVQMLRNLMCSTIWSVLHGHWSRWMVVVVGVICRWCLLCCWWSSMLLLRVLLLLAGWCCSSIEKADMFGQHGIAVNQLLEKWWE
uniref:Candidate secreted effector n=1 Tax=Meloidogyne incognita TaxID=6306 RepID=A0A914KX12_MELIC